MNFCVKLNKSKNKMTRTSYLSLVFLMFSNIIFSQNVNLFKIVEQDKVGYIDDKGKTVIQPIYFNGNDFCDGLAAVRQNGKYGFIDKNGKYAIEPKYDLAEDFENGIACVYVNGEAKFIDKNDKPVLNSAYKSIRFMSNKKAILGTKLNTYGIINLETNKLIVDTIFRSIKYFKNRLSIVTKNHSNVKENNNEIKYAVIDSLGAFVVNFDKYAEIFDFVDGYARVLIEDKQNEEGAIDGVIDSKGNLLFQKPYKDHCYISGDFHDGLAVINLYQHSIPEQDNTAYDSDKMYEGFVNLKGEVVLNDLTYKSVKDFADGRVFIENKDNQYFIFDTNFQKIGNNTFDNVLNNGFKNGFAIVEKDNKWGIIDTDGKFVVEPKYKSIDDLGVIDDYFFYEIYSDTDDKIYGIDSVKGNAIFEPIITTFDQSGFVNGLLKTIIDKKFTYINKNGKFIWQEKKEVSKNLKLLNIDFMNRGYFYAYSKPNKNDISGYGGSRNFPKKIKTEKFPENKISLIVETKTQEIIENEFIGYKVSVANRLNKNVLFSAQDSRIAMKVQALNDKNIWCDIEYLPNSWCGNSYHTLTLEPNNYWAFATPKYDGEFKTKFRIELKYLNPLDKLTKSRQKSEITIYSNEFDGSLNPAQFWNKRPYSPNGIMDSYRE